MRALPLSSFVPDDTKPGKIFADLAGRRSLTLTLPLLHVVSTIAMFGLTMLRVLGFVAQPRGEYAFSSACGSVEILCTGIQTAIGCRRCRALDGRITLCVGRCISVIDRRLLCRSIRRPSVIRGWCANTRSGATLRRVHLIARFRATTWTSIDRREFSLIEGRGRRCRK